MSKVIEWPKGSGRFAAYSDAELAFMRKLAESFEQKRISRAELNLQVGHFHDAKVEFRAVMVDPESEASAAARTQPPSKFYGADATDTEREAGEAVAKKRQGPIQKGGALHLALQAFGDGERKTAYDASVQAAGDYHAIRREATRLADDFDPPMLQREGTLPNQAPRGRDVQAFRITPHGSEQLRRLG